MQPSIIRETIVDRRQPALRWGAIFAGGAVSVGIWLLLQTLGMGIGLAAVDTTRHGWFHAVAVGASLWSLIAPLVAMFFGGLIAARFATTRARRIGSLHGIVMWALASVIGLGASVWMVTMLALGAHANGVALEGGPTPEMTGRALFWAGLTLLVSLGGAALGGALGVRRETNSEIRTIQPPVVPVVPPTELPQI